MAAEKNEGFVLLVDDDDAIRESLGELLESCGFTILRANCVDNGIKVIAENPDLVQILPELKGPKVDVFFVYPEELRNSKRVAVFRDFLLARLAERQH